MSDSSGTSGPSSKRLLGRSASRKISETLTPCLRKNESFINVKLEYEPGKNEMTDGVHLKKGIVHHL